MDFPDKAEGDSYIVHKHNNKYVQRNKLIAMRNNIYRSKHTFKIICFRLFLVTHIFYMFRFYKDYRYVRIS